ncbi:MAG: urate hydroxylase PuuD, partial [Ginsengibacter sp.]
MFHFVIYSILVLILIMLIWMTYHFRTLSGETKNGSKSNAGSDIYKNKLLGSHNFIYAAIILVIITILVFTYLIVKGTPLESHMMEWLNIVVRVMHITFGIAWIGASFYFVFLENALNRTENVRDELAGNLWAIHGGGFYYLEKYKTAPKVIPKHLHWFKYEAYFTWLSGFSLLFIIYYFNAKGFLIDTNVFAMSP